MDGYGCRYTYIHSVWAMVYLHLLLPHLLSSPLGIIGFAFAMISFSLLVPRKCFYFGCFLSKKLKILNVVAAVVGFY